MFLDAVTERDCREKEAACCGTAAVWEEPVQGRDVQHGIKYVLCIHYVCSELEVKGGGGHKRHAVGQRGRLVGKGRVNKERTEGISKKRRLVCNNGDTDRKQYMS